MNKVYGFCPAGCKYPVVAAKEIWSGEVGITTKHGAVYGAYELELSTAKLNTIYEIELTCKATRVTRFVKFRTNGEYTDAPNVSVDYNDGVCIADVCYKNTDGTLLQQRLFAGVTETGNFCFWVDGATTGWTIKSIYEITQ